MRLHAWMVVWPAACCRPISSTGSPVPRHQSQRDHGPQQRGESAPDLHHGVHVLLQHDHQAGEDEVDRGAEANGQEQAGHEQRRFPSSPGWAHDQEHSLAPGRRLRYARFISAQWP